MSAARLALAVFLCILPVTLVVPVLRPLVQDRYGVGDFATSLFMAVNMLGAVLCAPLAGALSDRLGRRRPLLVGALVADAVLLASLAHAPGYAALIGLRFIEGVAHIAALSLLLALAADRARRSGSGRTMGAVGATLTLGVALGAPIGGRLGQLGPEWPLLAGAGVALAGAIFVAVWLRDEEGGPGRPVPTQAGVRARAGAATDGAARRPGRGALALLREERRLLVPCAFAFVDRFTVGFFVTAFPLYLANVHGAGPARIGGLLALFLLPFALLCYPIGRLAEGRSRVLLMAGGSLAYGLLVVPVGLVAESRLPLLMPLLGLVSGAMFVPTLMLAGELAGPGRKALAMGAFNAAGSLGFLVGPVVAGLTSAGVGAAHGPAAGYAAAFAVAGASEVACVLVALPALRRLERSRRRELAAG